ncbi:MAG: type I 3-dehydroquinate dehydratase [Gemmataceae bacterium]|nr:type I 3-dehydroquinate dehydratase [Gemmataceae bacterium]
MICISINQESRRFALVDMLNAARFADLLEVRLDRFGKAPDLGELLSNKPKPVIMSCRRPQDGGYWDGSETERLAILRQCIISKADYVEIELDVADEIRRFPPSQRVISYTNLQETPSDILEIYEEAKTKSPDVIKLVTLTRTPEEAWPLVQIVAKATVPTVIVGLGKPGIMLTVLGQRIGAPWVYAALERGMEAYPGQPTIDDLANIYRLHDIQKSTRFVGVTGFGERETITVAALNAVFAQMQSPYRCLPMSIGDLKVFRKVIDAVKLGALVVDADHQHEIMQIGAEPHGAAKTSSAADVLIQKGGTWHAFHTAAQTWIEALKGALAAKFPGDNPLKDRMVVIVGLNASARILATEVLRHGGSAILASVNKGAGMQLAQQLGCRFILFDAIYSTMHDVLVVCTEERSMEPRKADEPRKPGSAGIHAGYLKAGMTVMDLTASARKSELLREAELRGCLTVAPRDLLMNQLEQQVKLLTGSAVGRDVLEAAVPERLREEAD